MTDRELAIEAAREGAAVIRERFGTDLDVRLKGTVDPVTETDREAEQAITRIISTERPGDGFLTEEGGTSGPESARRWIIDPIDGTINFIHGLPHVGVSVALYEGNEALVGVIVDVFRDQTFVAERGRGTTVDGQAAAVSARSDLASSLIVTGFPYDRQQHAGDYLRVVEKVLGRAQGIRRLGSAALDFAYVAAGRFDGFWEFLLAPWDVAAGVLLVREAGGRVVDHRGAAFELGGTVVVAGGDAIVAELLPLVADNLPPHLGVPVNGNTAQRGPY